MTRHRWKLAAAAVALLLFAWCYFPRGLTPEGGGWYTKYTSHFPESGGNIRLYRRFPLGIHVLVDERAYVNTSTHPTASCTSRVAPSGHCTPRAAAACRCRWPQG